MYKKINCGICGNVAKEYGNISFDAVALIHGWIKAGHGYICSKCKPAEKKPEPQKFNYYSNKKGNKK